MNDPNIPINPNLNQSNTISEHDLAELDDETVGWRNG